MKKYFIALFCMLLFVAVSYGQNYSKSDSLKSAGTTTSDTTAIIHIGLAHQYTYITYVDTGSVKTDTIYVYTTAGTDTAANSITATVWVQTGLINVVTNSVVPVIANAGAAKKYQLIDGRAKWVKIVLGNEEYLADRKGTFTIETK